MDGAAIQRSIDELWNESIVAELVEYIKIPNKSPAFDVDWQSHGYMEDAVSLIESWCRGHALPDMSIEVVRLAGRTPLILMEVPGQGDGRGDGVGNDENDGARGSGTGAVLLYGHLDKQPEMHGWRDGFGPWTPVIEAERLYGRGGADDGYAAFASLAAIRALAEQGIPHAR